MTEETPTRIVSPALIRQAFNEGGYEQQVAEGVLTTRIVRESHPSSLKAPEPYCTRSIVLSYWNANGERIAVVHQYLRRDGSLGASGRPDPKRLSVDGVVLIAETREMG